jgi:hypothetical protein
MELAILVYMPSYGRFEKSKLHARFISIKIVKFIYQMTPASFFTYLLGKYTSIKRHALIIQIKHFFWS